jgi:predicted CXXCH cytochrome family protein
MAHRFHVPIVFAVVAFAVSLGVYLPAQAPPGQTAPTSQGAPAQPAPSQEVSPVTPRGPIQLTATPPRINAPQPANNTQDVKARYVGSLACQRCHAATFERWSHTRMANVITDPKVNPSVVIGDFSKPNPLVNFRLEDVAWVYGTKWKQRYFLRAGNDYYPASAQWDVINRVWRPYHVQPNTEWWLPHYPAKPGDNSTRPSGPLCDGCHSTNYDVQTKQVTEWNVGCERCHGPGSEHVARPGKATIIDPSRLDYVAANDVCLQCHTQGKPTTNPHNGQYYDWPVGYHVGLDLKDFWTLEERHLGETTFTHFAEGTAKKNRMQANDYVDSLMYRRGVTCFSCHDVHGTNHNADLVKPPQQLCLTCHSPNSPNGPRAATIEAHTHHEAGSRGSQCVECHMPKIEQTIADVNVRSHSFKFITPSMSVQYKIPNPCTTCHTSQTNDWAKEQLKNWSGMSPWRVQ